MKMHKMMLMDEEFMLRRTRVDQENPMIELKRIARQSRERGKHLAAVLEEARYHYDEVRPGMVDSIIRRGAEAGLAYLSRRLGTFHPVGMKWFTEQTREERQELRELGALDCVDVYSFDYPVRGFTRLLGEVVWIKAGLSFWDTLFVIAHELIHTKQWSTPLTKDEREAVAERLAAEAIAELRGMLS